MMKWKKAIFKNGYSCVYTGVQAHQVLHWLSSKTYESLNNSILSIMNLDNAHSSIQRYVFFLLLFFWLLPLVVPTEDHLPQPISNIILCDINPLHIPFHYID